MRMSDKLKGKKNTAAEQVNVYIPGACQKAGCHGAYIPAKIGLKHADGRVWGEVCCKPTCYKCGHIRVRVEEGRRQEDYYYTIGDGRVNRNQLNFWVPREAIERPVFDKSGTPVLGADGQQVLTYDAELKKEFVRKIIGLAEKKKCTDQYFTLAEVMNAPA